MVFPIRLTLYVAAFATGVVAWVLNVPQLYWMCGVMLLLSPASWVLARLEHLGLEVERSISAAGHQGEVIPSYLTVRNRWPVPKLQLSISEDLPPGLTSEANQVPVLLPAGGVDRVAIDVRLARRGCHTLRSVTISGTDVLGITTLRSNRPCESRVLVYPRVIPLPSDLLPRLQGGGQLALESAGRQGDGSSFFGIREYMPGDPLRHVHWRTAARLGQLAVIEWEAEESAEVLITVDTRASVERTLGAGTTLDLAAGLAASLASDILNLGDGVRFIAAGCEAWEGDSALGRRTLPALLERLALMEAGDAQSLASQVQNATFRLAAGTLVCLISPAPDEELGRTVEMLSARRLRPVVYGLAVGETLGAWSAFRSAQDRLGLQVIVVSPDSPVVSRLLE